MLTPAKKCYLYISLLNNKVAEVWKVHNVDYVSDIHTCLTSPAKVLPVKRYICRFIVKYLLYFFKHCSTLFSHLFQTD